MRLLGQPHERVERLIRGAAAIAHDDALRLLDDRPGGHRLFHLFGESRRALVQVRIGDGHRRVTTTDHFLIVGGSAATHERMQDAAVKFNEALDRRGQELKEIEPTEIADLLREAHE